MLSVLKQEFKIHKKNIFITAIIFAAIYLCTIFSMHLSGLFESEKIQDISALWFGLSVGLGCIGAFFIALFNFSSCGDIPPIVAKQQKRCVPVSYWEKCHACNCMVFFNYTALPQRRKPYNKICDFVIGYGLLDIQLMYFFSFVGNTNKKV